MVWSLQLSQEAESTQRVRPSLVGSPSFAGLETWQPGVKSDSQGRGRQAEKSRATRYTTATCRRLLIFRVAIGILTFEASSAVEPAGRKRRAAQRNARRSVRPSRRCVPGCAAVYNASHVKGSTASRRKVGRGADPTGRSARPPRCANQMDSSAGPTPCACCREQLSAGSSPGDPWRVRAFLRRGGLIPPEASRARSGRFCSTVDRARRAPARSHTAAGAPCRVAVSRVRSRRGRPVGSRSLALSRVCVRFSPRHEVSRSRDTAISSSEAPQATLRWAVTC